MQTIRIYTPWPCVSRALSAENMQSGRLFPNIRCCGFKSDLTSRVVNYFIFIFIAFFSLPSTLFCISPFPLFLHSPAATYGKKSFSKVKVKLVSEGGEVECSTHASEVPPTMQQRGSTLNGHPVANQALTPLRNIDEEMKTQGLNGKKQMKASNNF